MINLGGHAHKDCVSFLNRDITVGTAEFPYLSFSNDDDVCLETNITNRKWSYKSSINDKFTHKECVSIRSLTTIFGVVISTLQQYASEQLQVIRYFLCE